MKIALILYPINDLGGIINHTENLTAGLRELGHSVNLHFLYWQTSFQSPKYSNNELLKKGWSYGNFEVVHQRDGWNLIPWEGKLLYKTKEDRKRTKEILSSYDLLIWEVPVPSKGNQNRGNHDWMELYSCTKNIAISHDGNLFNIPWICEILPKLTGLACVHETSFNLAKNLNIPRALILNPQDLNGIEEIYDYDKRADGFLSLQVFKGWKRVDDLIRAIPYLPASFRKIMAGGGIEQRYMVARHKVKEKYFCRQEDDPDLPENIVENKIRIWDRALYNGMEWLGFISAFQRDFLLRQVKTLIDPSWSRRYSNSGGHFNRTIVDAIKMGTIPVATNLGMSDNLKGEGMLFKPKENYIMIPYNLYPREYAGVIEYASHLSKQEFLTILENNYSLLQLFNRRNIAQDFINLSNEKSCGFLGKRFKGTLHKDLKLRSDDIMEDFFGKGKFKLKKKGGGNEKA